MPQIFCAPSFSLDGPAATALAGAEARRGREGRGLLLSLGSPPAVNHELDLISYATWMPPASCAWEGPACCSASAAPWHLKDSGSAQVVQTC